MNYRPIGNVLPHHYIRTIIIVIIILVVIVFRVQWLLWLLWLGSSSEHCCHVSCRHRSWRGWPRRSCLHAGGLRFRHTLLSLTICLQFYCRKLLLLYISNDGHRWPARFRFLRDISLCKNPRCIATPENSPFSQPESACSIPHTVWAAGHGPRIYAWVVFYWLILGLAYMRGWYSTDAIWASHMCEVGSECVKKCGFDGWMLDLEASVWI